MKEYTIYHENRVSTKITKDTGDTRPLPAGEESSQIENQSIREMETGKKTTATKETLNSSPAIGTARISLEAWLKGTCIVDILTTK